MPKTKELIKNILTNLKEKHQILTPRNYFLEFKNEALKHDIKIKEFEEFEKIYLKLTQDELHEHSEIHTFNELAEIFSKRINTIDLKMIIKLLNQILVPSIDQKIDETNKKELFEILEKTPTKLVEQNMIDKIKEINQNRLKADRVILRQKTEDIVKLTKLLGKYFDKSIIESTNTTDELNKIKDELNELNISKESQRELSKVQKKLIDTIFELEHSMKNSKDILIQNKEKFKLLNKTIEDLQKKLEFAKIEKSIDYLTGHLNRRAYHDEVEKIEQKHELFHVNYAVVFFDIDHFKNINDTYGHTCGDAILKNFANILTMLTRQEDVLCRYGGEEFIALIHCDDEKDVEKYLKRVKEKIKHTNFSYKENRIEVKFSSGITFRNKHSSYMDAKKSADELLYKAKQAGRDKIIFDNGTEF